MAEENLAVLIQRPPDHAKTLAELKSKIFGEGGERASPASSSSKPKCPKFPKKLLPDLKDQDCNVPQRMSLGPYHHGNTRLAKLASAFIIEHELNVVEIYNSICNCVVELKACYEEETAKKFVDDDFTAMMLVDGCALLCFITYAVGLVKVDHDIRYQDLSLLHQDALLLENQLPYQLLQLLMDSVDTTSQVWKVIFLEFFGLFDDSYFQEFFGMKEEPLLQRMKDCCRQLCLPDIRCIEGNPEPKPEEEYQPTSEKDLKPKPEEGSQPKLEEKLKPKMEEESQPIPKEESTPYHLLGFYRNSLLGDAGRFNGTRNNKKDLTASYSRRSQKKKEISIKDVKEQQMASFRNVKDLTAAGIRIKPSPTRYLRDISFTTNGITACLRLPRITIDKSTKTLFFNLIAHEMSSDVPHDFISYLSFLDSLIDHADDVKELQSAGVLRNNLGTHEEVAAFFNTVSAKLDSNPHTYKDAREKIRKHLDGHYNSKLKRWMTQCLDTYFSGPWAIIAWIAAALALFLTVVQTYFSAFPPRSNHAYLSRHL